MHRSFSRDQYRAKKDSQQELEFVRLATVFEPEHHHVCIERRETGLLQWLRAWYFPPAHLICSVLFWYLMLGVLQGRKFSIGQESERHALTTGR